MAAKVSVELKLDQGAIVRVVGGQAHAACKQAADRTLARARANLVSAGRMNTGKLYDSLMVLDVTGNPLVPSFAVGSGLNYAIYQEKGTGGARARAGGFLVFRPKGSGRLVFARQVRGFSGANYLRNAVDAVTVSDFT